MNIAYRHIIIKKHTHKSTHCHGSLDPHRETSVTISSDYYCNDILFTVFTLLYNIHGNIYNKINRFCGLKDELGTNQDQMNVIDFHRLRNLN